MKKRHVYVHSENLSKCKFLTSYLMYYVELWCAIWRAICILNLTSGGSSTCSSTKPSFYGRRMIPSPVYANAFASFSACECQLTEINRNCHLQLSCTTRYSLHFLGCAAVITTHPPKKCPDSDASPSLHEQKKRCCPSKPLAFVKPACQIARGPRQHSNYNYQYKSVRYRVSEDHP